MCHLTIAILQRFLPAIPFKPGAQAIRSFLRISNGYPNFMSKIPKQEHQK
jgi:hypothetical protein